MTARQRIRIVNQSTLVDDASFGAMFAACVSQMSVAAPLWGRHVPSLSHQTVKGGGDTTDLDAQQALLAREGEYVIVLIDDADQAGDLGWHTEDASGVYGFVFVRPSLEAGSTLLDGPYAVSSVLSHELLETLIDPDVNGWWQINNDALVAAEICDPVENLTYSVSAADGRQVALSDFVLPTWSDVNAPADATRDYMGYCTEAFQVSPGGYVVIWDTRRNHVGQVFGESYPADRMPYKQRAGGRGQRRVTEHPE